MNYKIEVENKEQADEAQELFSQLGFSKDICSEDKYPKLVITNEDYSSGAPLNYYLGSECESVSLVELRALVSLHKNPINMDKVLSEVRSDTLGLLEDKEWLNTKTYEYKKAVDMGGHNKWIEIPEGAKKATKLGVEIVFWNGDDSFVFNLDDKWSSQPDSMSFNTYVESHNGVEIIWQRHAQPEELPPVDDLPDFSFEDTVNHPSHYASGEIECIDAIESSMTNEAFCGYLKGNVQKYMWRYESKGGLESLEKAQWYLNKLISRIS